nr:hypothetical protein [Tanacetum cinerariifolium]
MGLGPIYLTKVLKSNLDLRATYSRYDQASKGSKSSCDGCRISKSWITCVNTNGNTKLSKAQEVSLRITSDVRVSEKLSGECDVMRRRERAREEECEGLRVKCEAAMIEFEKNPAVVADSV